MVALILIAAAVFHPIRNWIQEQLDRYYFYKDRYDYRRTLIEFARELGSPTDLGEMLESVADRLIRTLAFATSRSLFWTRPKENSIWSRQQPPRPPDRKHTVRPGSEFFESQSSKPYLFFERTRNLLDVVSHEMPAAVRRSISELELTYCIRHCGGSRG